MISTINFYDKTFTLRDEIYYIISNNELTIKSRTNVKCSQRFP